MTVPDIDAIKGKAGVASLRYHVLESVYIADSPELAFDVMRRLRGHAELRRQFVVYDEWTSQLVWEDL